MKRTDLLIEIERTRAALENDTTEISQVPLLRKKLKNLISKYEIKQAKNFDYKKAFELAEARADSLEILVEALTAENKMLKEKLNGKA